MSEEAGRTINLIAKQAEDFIDSIRPPEDIREQLDVGYTFENNTLEIFEIRPRWDKQDEKVHTPVVKTQFVKTREVWVIYWMGKGGKWEKYPPKPEVDSIRDVFETLKNDHSGHFWG